MRNVTKNTDFSFSRTKFIILFHSDKGRNVVVERNDNQSRCKTKIYKSLVSVHTTVDFKCSIAEICMIQSFEWLNCDFISIQAV
jgi:hypothetical protein